jgi:ABC-type transporter Mla subunit MlaD
LLLGICLDISIKLIEANAQKQKAVGDKIDNLEDEIGAKEEASKKVDDVSNNLPDSGETTPEQNKAVDDTVTDLMKDLLNDPNIDPDTVTREM